MTKKNIIRAFIALTAICIAVYIKYNYSCIISSFESFASWLFPADKNHNGELLKIALNILGGLGILFGLYVSLRRANAMERGVLEQSKQIKIAQESQSDERFKNAIEHLGSDKEPIILGGIAELHHLVQEEQAKYKEVVANIFCSYIRSSANVTQKKAYEINNSVIQNIINILTRTESYQDVILDLSHCNLNGINFDNSQLKGLNLSFCILPGLKKVNLNGCNLSNSEFSCCYIENVKLEDTDLSATSFHLTEISDTRIINDVDLIHTSLIDSKLENVYFSNNTDVIIRFVNSLLKGCYFSHSEIVNSTFIASELDNVTFSNNEKFILNDFRCSTLKDVSITPSLLKNNFRGCLNKTLLTFELSEKLDMQIGKDTDISGLKVTQSDIKHNDITSLNLIDKNEILELHKKLMESRLSQNIKLFKKE